MIRLKNRWIIILAIILILPLAGCANSVRLQFESMGSRPPTDEARTTIQGLAENWTDYDIHYSGSSSSNASGILFDPKNDDRRLVPEGDAWKKVEDQETLNVLVKWNASQFNYIARLMQVVHPNGQSFGYLYLNIQQNFAGLRAIDDKTIVVFPVRKDDPAVRISL